MQGSLTHTLSLWSLSFKLYIEWERAEKWVQAISLSFLTCSMVDIYATNIQYKRTHYKVLSNGKELLCTWIVQLHVQKKAARWWLSLASNWLEYTFYWTWVKIWFSHRYIKCCLDQEICRIFHLNDINTSTYYIRLEVYVWNTLNNQWISKKWLIYLFEITLNL